MQTKPATLVALQFAGANHSRLAATRWRGGVGFRVRSILAVASRLLSKSENLASLVKSRLDGRL